MPPYWFPIVCVLISGNSTVEYLFDSPNFTMKSSVLLSCVAFATSVAAAPVPVHTFLSLNTFRALGRQVLIGVHRTLTPSRATNGRRTLPTLTALPATGGRRILRALMALLAMSGRRRREILLAPTLSLATSGRRTPKVPMVSPATSGRKTLQALMALLATNGRRSR